MSAQPNKKVWEKNKLIEWFEMFLRMLYLNLKCCGWFIKWCIDKQGNEE